MADVEPESDTQVVEHVVDEHQADMRVDAVLAAVLPWRSRRELAGFIGQGAVTVDAVRVKKSRRLRPGEVVRIALPRAAEDLDAIRALPLDILYEDEDLVVVDKPSGLRCIRALACSR